ncbi:MAG: TIGR01906 family membrane protein [Lachnospiraceae bacterium]|nr:TIGR01906 family membrane protein [Lachnospiraceae bacterium]
MKKTRDIPFEPKEGFHWTDIPTGICFLLALIAVGLALAINLRPLYYLDITWFDIPGESGLNAVVIKENYNALIDYCSPFFKGELTFPSLRASASGISHFAEVKHIFNVIYIVGLISLVICIVSFIIKKKSNETRYLLVAGIVALVIPVLFVIFALINFNAMFTLFHLLAFKNGDWMFDPATDPVINILPESFFMQCGMIIAATVIIGAVTVILIWLFRRKNRKEVRLLPPKKNYYY